jgi:hypothetical protein
VMCVWGVCAAAALHAGGDLRLQKALWNLPESLLARAVAPLAHRVSPPPQLPARPPSRHPPRSASPCTRSCQCRAWGGCRRCPCASWRPRRSGRSSRPLPLPLPPPPPPPFAPPQQRCLRKRVRAHPSRRRRHRRERRCCPTPRAA